MVDYQKITCILLFCASGLASAQGNLFSVQDLAYQGATRIPLSTFGVSRMGFANGTFLVDSNRNSVFVAGHNQHKAIAEFSIEGFEKSLSLSDLPMVTNIQPFTKVLERVPSGNSDNLDHFTGMHMINGDIWINAAEFYDGDADNADTSFVIDDPSNLASSAVRGFFQLEAGVKASGWISEIPQNLKDTLGGDYIFGYASNLPINSRNSMGPTAYAVNAANLSNISPGTQISTLELLSFSIQNQLHPDHYNKNLENDIWTEVSNAYTGFIVPGTDTYAVFGTSGGHESGIGYKITQDSGYECGGACPFKASDIYNHYWLWDIKDLIKVKQGHLAPYEVRPYDYGRLELPFEKQALSEKPNLMIAAYFDSSTEELYFMMGGVDSLQSQYETAPVLIKYSLEIGNRPSAPSMIRIE